MPTIRDETHKKELIHRLRRVEGQLRGIQAMIEKGSDCEASRSSSPRSRRPSTRPSTRALLRHPVRRGSARRAPPARRWSTSASSTPRSCSPSSADSRRQAHRLITGPLSCGPWSFLSRPSPRGPCSTASPSAMPGASPCSRPTAGSRRRWFALSTKVARGRDSWHGRTPTSCPGPRSSKRTWDEALHAPHAGDLPVLLAPAEEQALWESIIAESRHAKELLLGRPRPPPPVARPGNCSIVWRIASATAAADTNEDAKAFGECRRATSARRARAASSISARLPDALARLLGKGGRKALDWCSMRSIS